ncbi:MAG: TIGR00297 family protein [Haloferacaceae archaeon]
MTTPLRRAGGFAVVGSLCLAAPALGRAAAFPFVAVALLAAFVVDEGPLFELFARPRDRREGRLGGLAGFALAAAGLALLASLSRPAATMPATVFVAAVLTVAYGNLGARLVEETTDDPFHSVAGYAAGAFLAATGGQVAVAASTGTVAGAVGALPRFAFLSAAAALVAALLHVLLYVRDDPLVMLSVGFLLWLFEAIAGAVTPVEVAVALGVTVALGYVSYGLGTASVPGMLTGVLLGLLTVVLGGLGWFAVLIAFFAVGGLSAKYRYEEKRSRGVAEGNEGARGTGNVLGNAAVALGAVIGFAAVPALPVDATLFRFAFAGSVAAAMSDTLSSEIGGLFDRPRLVTTLERVDPGTDGGVTWQGTLAGLAGAGLVAAVATLLLPPGPGLVAAGVVVVAGVAGMFVDSLLGATVEGERIGNQAVNFLATLSGAGVCVVLATVAL